MPPDGTDGHLCAPGQAGQLQDARAVQGGQDYAAEAALGGYRAAVAVLAVIGLSAGWLAGSGVGRIGQPKLRQWP
jgi:hypothetical protein